VRPRRCKVCNHLEHAFLTALLEQGFGPRTISRRVGGVGRKDLLRHKNLCLQQSEKEDNDAPPDE
jgi:hypothetical protein